MSDRGRYAGFEVLAPGVFESEKGLLFTTLDGEAAGNDLLRWLAASVKIVLDNGRMNPFRLALRCHVGYDRFLRVGQ